MEVGVLFDSFKIITYDVKSRDNNTFGKSPIQRGREYLCKLESMLKDVRSLKKSHGSFHRSETRHPCHRFEIHEYGAFLHRLKEVDCEMCEVLGEYDALQKGLDSHSALSRKIKFIKEEIEKGVSPAQWLRDERVHHLWQVSMLITHMFRDLFGCERYNQCGYFLERDMRRMVHHYGCYVDYPDGHHELKEHTDLMRALIVSDDGCYLYTTGRDKTVIAWDLQSNSMLHRWEAHSDYVACLDYHSGTLASAGKDTNICIWNAYTFELLDTLEGHTGPIPSVRFNQSKDRLISCAFDSTIREWCLISGECLRQYIGHSGWVFSAHFIGDVMISSAMDIPIRVWDRHNSQTIRSVSVGPSEEAKDIYVNCDSSLICCTRYDSFLTVYTWPELDIYRVIPIQSIRACFHPFIPNILAFGDSEWNVMKVMDVDSEETLFSLNGHSHIITNTGFTPDGRRLISVSNDKTTRIWDVSSMYEEKRETKRVVSKKDDDISQLGNTVDDPQQTNESSIQCGIQ